MISLPIVQRELRVTTRRRATYWIRSFAVVLATVIAFYMLTTVEQWATPAQAGANLFATLTGVAYFCCLFPGVFLTADCLSEEKREGTLGLLFLTDLKGYDVVLGKLAVTSLNAFYALLAIGPLLALPMLMGGVTLGELGRVMLALVNTLVFSLAMGLFISSISWKEQNAMMAAAGLLFFTGIILPALGGPYEWLSPRLAFRHAASANFLAWPQVFCWGLLLVQGFSWGLLLIASRKASHAWQMDPAPVENLGENPPHTAAPTEIRPAGEAEEPASGVNVGASSRGGQIARKELLGRNPTEWLAGRNRSNAWVWGSLGLLAFGWFIVCLEQGRSSSFGSFIGSFSMALSLHGLLKFWIALEAARRFFEQRRDGTLESLLSTPLSLAEIMHGQFQSLFHQFAGPVAGVLLLDLLLISWLGASAIFHPFSFLTIWSFFAMMAILVMDAYALAWVGLWLGSKAKKSWTAAFAALARILLLPTSIFLAATMAFTSYGGFRGATPAIMLGLWVLIGVSTSWLFGTQAHRKLHHDFRETATDEAYSLPASLVSPPPEPPEMAEYFSLFKK